MLNPIFNNKKNKEKDNRIPLRIPVPPFPEYKKNDENDKKSYNDRVIDVNKEFEVDFDINKDEPKAYICRSKQKYKFWQTT
jgi:hypothetical protein